MSAIIGDPIRLHDGPAPGSESWTHEEHAYFSEVFDTDVVTNVVVPTVTPVLPDGPGNGAAVVVAPGGGFHALSIESEGFAVARWLADRGTAAFVLKYRLVPSGDDAVTEFGEKLAADPELVDRDIAAVVPLAGADAEVAMRLIRDRAGTFGVDPERVGFMGFSAGGNVALWAGHASDERARPDFLAPIYATARGFDLVEPPPGSGPMFVVAATDDELGLADDTIRIAECWRRAGLPVELHLYATGGHGFGMRTQGLPSDSWIDRFGDWLDAAGLTTPST